MVLLSHHRLLRPERPKRNTIVRLPRMPVKLKGVVPFRAFFAGPGEAVQIRRNFACAGSFSGG